MGVGEGFVSRRSRLPGTCLNSKPVGVSSGPVLSSGCSPPEMHNKYDKDKVLKISSIGYIVI